MFQLTTNDRDMIEVFDNTTDVINEIKSRINTGNEQTVNDCLHFGVGGDVYAYASDCLTALQKGYEVRGVEGKNPLFMHLHDGNVERMLQYLLDTDGYLAIQ